MNTSPNITHEADSQRQHVRVPLPAHIEIDSQVYEMKDWSVVGACVQIPDQSGLSAFSEGAMASTTLLFTLDSFDVRVPMEIAIQHVDTDKQQLGVQFHDMSARQLSVMQMLVGSYVSGEITSVGDLIHVVARDNFVKQRSIPKLEQQSLGRRLSIFSRKLLVSVVSALLFAYLAFSVYERNFVVKADNAFVDGGGFNVNTETGGTIFYGDLKRGDRVNKGDALVTIHSRTGNVTTIDSPCDCIVNQQLMPSGSRVNQNDSVLTLIPAGSPLFVSATLTYEEAVRIQEGQGASIALAGADIRIEGMVESISNAAIEDNLYQIRVVTDEAINADLLGTAAAVTVDTLQWSE